MQPRIDLISIIAQDLPAMRAFYSNVLDFPIEIDMDQYVEFTSPTVRLALSTPQVLHAATQHQSYATPVAGQRFELAFRCATPAELEHEYQRITHSGATPITAPADMPWGQKTAFFADPDGNIHELFCDSPMP